MRPVITGTLPWLCGLLLALFVSWVYWPGQSGPALLDDRSSVLVIADLKQQPELARDFVYGDRSGALGRSVSMATFVLERLFLDGGLATSKQVNILLHALNGGLVICVFALLFGYLGVPAHRWLALLLGGAWLLAPLYVSTVLYIVQRMAMLSTFFMLLACIAFLRWRIALGQGRRNLPALLALAACFLLGLFAKENTIVLVPVLLTVEALWFQFEDARGRPIPWLRGLTLGLVATGGIGLLLLLVLDYEDIAGAFRYRPFTLEERVMTQGRILWDYVAQLAWPDVARMGLYHDDYAHSTAMTQPPSTAWAALAWGAMLGLLALLLRWPWGRRLALGPAWFLLGHSVESSVLPLELYFEHRNYFPGIGLFLLAGTGCALLLRRWPPVSAPLLAWMSCLLLWWAALTGSQVQIWSNHSLLLLSHLGGHPQSFRANADMAVQMANLGDLEAARAYSGRAFSVSNVERSGDQAVRDLALACLANQPVNPDQIEALGTVNPRRPFSSVITVLTLVRLLQDDSCPEFDRLALADRMVEIFLSEGSRATASADMYNNLAVLENALQRWEYANAYIDRFLAVRPNNSRGLLMKLHFVTALGKVEEKDAVVARLENKQAHGALTVGQQQTLSLYLEREIKP